MKKRVWKLAAVGMMLLFAPNVNAQIDLGNVLGSVLGSSGSTVGDLASGLTSVFSSDKQASKNNIIGTWTYTEPAIVFSSDNLLTKAASKLAANKVEAKLQEQLSKYGIKPGAMSMTFNEDGTFTETVMGKTVNGQWSVKDSKLVLTVATVQALSVTTQIDGKDMQIVTDATKLLNLFKTVGAQSTNSTLKTVTSLMKSVNGMQAGITLRKQ